VLHPRPFHVGDAGSNPAGDAIRSAETVSGLRMPDTPTDPLSLNLPSAALNTIRSPSVRAARTSRSGVWTFVVQCKSRSRLRASNSMASSASSMEFARLPARVVCHRSDGAHAAP